MSLLGLPIPVPGLYAKNNLNDGLRHRAASTVCDWEAVGQSKARADGQKDGWADSATVRSSRMKFQPIWRRDYG